MQHAHGVQNLNSPLFTTQPFTAKLENGKDVSVSTDQKILTVVTSIFIGLFTLGIGGVLAFFVIAKALRDRNIKEMMLEETPLDRLKDNIPIQPKNEDKIEVKEDLKPQLVEDDKKNKNEANQEVKQPEKPSENKVEELKVEKEKAPEALNPPEQPPVVENVEQKAEPQINNEAIIIKRALVPDYVDPCDDPAFVDALQEKLNAKNIPLNVKDTSRKLEYPNRILKENIEQMLQKARDEDRLKNHPEILAAVEKFYNHMDLISYNEFLQGLKGCCDFLNECLGDENYAIGTAPNSSYGWAATLALPFLNKTPEDHIPIDRPTVMPDIKLSDVPPSIKNYVIFNDMDYDGTYAFDLVRSATKELKAHPDKHLFIVIPLISPYTESWIKQNIEDAQLNKQIHLITSERSIKEMRGTFTVEEIKNLVRFDASDQDKGEERRYLSKQGNPNHYLSLAEWYITNDCEVPQTLKYRIDSNKLKDLYVTDYAPPYELVD